MCYLIFHNERTIDRLIERYAVVDNMKTVVEKKICSRPRCNNKVSCHDLCKKHYDGNLHSIIREQKCQQGNCTKPQRRRKLCSHHYGIMMQTQRCTIDNCTKIIYREEMCPAHYLRFGTNIVCNFTGCDSKEIYCLKSMMCKLHYNQEYRTMKLIGNAKKIIDEFVESQPELEKVKTVE